MPRPYQLSCKPCCSNNGTSVPDAATPRPTPAKITPPTMPRRAAEICGRMTDAASTMMMPPVRPARKRHAKNQLNDKGAELAKKERVAIDIIALNARTVPMRVASARAASAPAR